MFTCVLLSLCMASQMTESLKIVRLYMWCPFIETDIHFLLKKTIDNFGDLVDLKIQGARLSTMPTSHKMFNRCCIFKRPP